MDNQIKICYKCEKQLPFSAFSKCVGHKNDLQAVCKKCTSHYRTKYYWIHRDKAIIDAARWQKTHKDSRHRTHAKRKRNLNWVRMFPNPFTDNIEIEWHHITDTYVVALPTDLHHLYVGKYHRENLMTIIKQIYLKE